MKDTTRRSISLTIIVVLLSISQSAFANLTIVFGNNLVDLLTLEIVDQPHGNFWINGQKWSNQSRFTIDQTRKLDVGLTTTGGTTYGEGTIQFFNTKNSSSCTLKFQYCSVAGNCGSGEWNNSKITMLDDSNGLCERSFIHGEGDSSITVSVDE